MESLSSLKSFLASKKVSIDNKVFHLHRTTSTILFALSIITTSTVYFKNAIECTTSNNEYLERVINNYCWIHSTYTLPDYLISNGTKKEVLQAHPGVASSSDEDNKTYHTYYQWVCFVLFFQAIAFRVPQYLWKSWEGGRIRALSKDLSSWKIDSKEQMDKKSLILEYFEKTKGYNQLYAWSFFACEILNMANIIIQIHFTDRFVNYAFTTYGFDVLKFPNENPLKRTDPMAHAFPKVTKCVFRAFGPSGDIIPYDAMCVLSLNIINEKIYIFLWFWFIFLGTVTGLSLIYRLVTLVSSKVRCTTLKMYTRINPEERNFEDRFHRFCDSLYVGDWFLLRLLGREMGEIVFTDFIKDLSGWKTHDRMNHEKLKQKYQ